MSQSIDEILEAVESRANYHFAIDEESQVLAAEVRRLREREKVLVEKCKHAVMGAYESCGSYADTGHIPSDAQIVNTIWYAPKWGCDTLDHIMDALDGIAFDKPPIA